MGGYEIAGWGNVSVKLKFLFLSALVLPLATPAIAAPEVAMSAAAHPGYAAQLGPNAQALYRDIFSAIRAGNWTDAAAKLSAMPDGPLHNAARAELYLAKGSPAVSGDALRALLARAPEMPQATQLERLARTRGIDDSFAIPSSQELTWLGSAPRRSRLSRTEDALAGRMAARIIPLIKDNRPNEAEAIVLENEANLSVEARTEWQQRVAWSYYIVGDDEGARRLAAKAQAGSGDWAAMADWSQGLASWRQKDYTTAAAAFASAATRFDDNDMRSAANFWAGRAYMAKGEPQKIDFHLKAAARDPETFYGLLALNRMGINAKPADPDGIGKVERLPNVRAALALSEIGELTLADSYVRHQARIGDARDHGALAVLAGRLELPATQLFLAHNGPAGAKAPVSARYPMPRNWMPDGGWRVDKSLVYAHTLQESQFRAGVTSGAGAKGLMQVRPGTAGDIARARGQQLGSLTKPSTNLEYGQSYIEHIRDMPATGAWLPKVIAAYNAGPTPVAVWNERTRDNTDPLLYIESIPYWETRAYVTIVLRNYWMYQLQAGDKTNSLSALSQGLWPRFPGMPGPAMVRLDRVGGVASAD
jgi:soluble lytic murein transglycosylase